jgi:hypothetical protein
MIRRKMKRIGKMRDREAEMGMSVLEVDDRHDGVGVLPARYRLAGRIAHSSFPCACFKRMIDLLLPSKRDPDCGRKQVRYRVPPAKSADERP